MDPMSEYLSSHHGYSQDEWDGCCLDEKDHEPEYTDTVNELLIPDYDTGIQTDQDPEPGVSIWDLVYEGNGNDPAALDQVIEQVEPLEAETVGILEGGQVDMLDEMLKVEPLGPTQVGPEPLEAGPLEPASDMPYQVYIDEPGDLDAMFQQPNSSQIMDSYGFDPSIYSSGDCNDSDYDAEMPRPRSFRFQPTTTQESFGHSLSNKRKLNPMLRVNGTVPHNYANNVATFNANAVFYNRARSISKMSLVELYEVMGLGHDHSTAIEREEHIMCILEKHGFCVGEKTWIRDTEEHSRRVILDAVYNETIDTFGYSKRILEAIIRRGTYARMQSNLRRRRRRRKKASRS